MALCANQAEPHHPLEATLTLFLRVREKNIVLEIDWMLQPWIIELQAASILDQWL
jgi:hypothetical protein